MKPTEGVSALFDVDNVAVTNLGDTNPDKMVQDYCTNTNCNQLKAKGSQRKERKRTEGIQGIANTCAHPTLRQSASAVCAKENGSRRCGCGVPFEPKVFIPRAELTDDRGKLIVQIAQTVAQTLLGCEDAISVKNKVTVDADAITHAQLANVRIMLKTKKKYFANQEEIPLNEEDHPYEWVVKVVHAEVIRWDAQKFFGEEILTTATPDDVDTEGMPMCTAVDAPKLLDAGCSNVIVLATLHENLPKIRVYDRGEKTNLFNSSRNVSLADADGSWRKQFRIESRGGGAPTNVDTTWPVRNAL